MNNINQFVVDNMSLVPFTIKKYFGITKDFEDLCSIGYIALIKAAKSFDETKTKFSTYASRCIRNEILTKYFRKENKIKDNEISLFNIVAIDEIGNNLTYEDILPSNENLQNDFIKNENLDKINLLMNELSEKRRNIIKLKYFSNENYTNKQIADILNIPPSTVTTNIARGLEFFKRRLK